MKKNTVFGIIIVILVAILIFVSFSKTSSKESVDSNLDTFAKCLKDSGATFYGASWCSHCQNQKEDFGSSAKYLPYVECSTPDGRGQTQKCKNDGITGYPTWKFADGSSLSGEVKLEVLAQKANCQLEPLQ